MSKQAQHNLILDGGRHVPFSLKTRDGDPYIFICFRGPDGRRLERSSKETNRKRAVQVAEAVIREVYDPRPAAPLVDWDAAVALLVEKMKAQNLRPRSIADYTDMVKRLREVVPESRTPADLTPEQAARFKTERSKEVAPETLYGNINKLSVLYEKWLQDECRLVMSNPWTDVEKPKLDEPEPRYIEPEEAQAFFAWLARRWDGCRLPVLFFQVKGHVGRRILQLSALPATCLKDGRIVFVGETCKGRRMEYGVVPDEVYQELEAIAGPTYLWERYSEELNAIYRRRGQRRYARCGEFQPPRLKRFLQAEITAYNTENEGKPGFVPFTAHNFRDTAMTKSWDADIPVDKGAIAFGCDPATMMKHYVRKNKLAITDDVFGRIQKMQAAEAEQVKAPPAGDGAAPAAGADESQGAA